MVIKSVSAILIVHRFHTRYKEVPNSIIGNQEIRPQITDADRVTVVLQIAKTRIYISKEARRTSRIVRNLGSTYFLSHLCLIRELTRARFQGNYK